MKKMVVISVLFFGITLCAFAQEEKKMAIGFGAEMNMNARETLGAGASLGFNYNLPSSEYLLATGLTVTGSSNFTDTVVVEVTALIRWYFMNTGYSGWFAQADAGYCFVSEGSNKKLPSPISVGVRTGYRLPMGASFFVEPYARFGYSFLFGIGVAAGVRF